MTWLAQVAHVARKDIMVSRWYLLIYFATVAASTAAAVFVWALPDVMPLAFALWVLGIVLTGGILQADSPAQTDAFWVTRPLRPTAVAAAKLAFTALIVIGVVLIGQLIALLSYDLGVARALPLLGSSALVYSSMIMVALLVAALTRDMRSFVAAMVVIPVVWTIAWIVLASLVIAGGPGDEPRVAWISSSTASALLVVAVALLLLRQYVTRNVRHGIITTALLLAMLMAAILGADAEPSMRAHASPHATALRIDSVQMGWPGVTSARQLPLRLAVSLHGAEPGFSYILQTASLDIEMANGEWSRVRIGRGETGPSRIALNDPVRSGLGAVQWVDRGESRAEPAIVSVNLEAPAQAAVRSGARLRLSGEIIVREPRVLVELPLAGVPDVRACPGGCGNRIVATRDGVRVRVVETTSAMSGPSLDLDVRSVGHRLNAPAVVVFSNGSFIHDIEVVLHNVERREAIHLRRSAGSGNPGLLVIPGAGAWTDRITVSLPDDRSAPPYDRLTATWLSAARAAVIKWVDHAVYPVSATTVVPPEPQAYSAASIRP